MYASAILRRVGWTAFVFMWVPFAVLMISMFSLPNGSYAWSEIPRAAQLSIITVGALALVAMVCLVGAPIVNGFQNRALKEDGLPAEADILGLSDTGTTINKDPVVRIRLEVQPKNELPYEAEAERLIPRVQLPQIQPRVNVQVRYDPDSLAGVILDEDE